MSWSLTRRAFLKLTGLKLAGAAGLSAAPALAQASPRVVVVGGGFAGATAARALKTTAPRISVTLVTAESNYTACPMSNLVLSGLRAMAAQRFGYGKVAAAGVEVVVGTAVGVDAQARTVSLEGGAKLSYDRLILAPGIDLAWDALPGYTEAAAERMPHAWKAGTQTLLPRRQLESMEDGGLVVMAVPDNPFRCPPGPYERASLIAHFLKTRKRRSKLLAPDEALVVFLDAPANGSLLEATFIFIVTHDQFYFGATRLGTRVLNDYVLALRCGLDGQGTWANANLARTCTRLLGREKPLEPGEAMPFEAGLAHELYNGLFEGVDHVIRGKKLLVVPSGALTALPFQVLVTERPTIRDLIEEDFSRLARLARTSPVTVLPSVASLKSLRRQAAPSKAASPCFGIGIPLLTGPDGKDRRAWERQSCGRSSVPRPQVASRSGSTRFSRLFRGGLADVEEARRMDPLPETVDELCAVAELAGAGAESVLLGERASEREMKALSRSGALANARVLLFATHGLLAGETQALSTRRGEPALPLTPPEQASEEDDGLLTASEVSQLRLDADWVGLSACNTASGAALEAEALSVLARAFFYAGARSLLVSHSYVDSDATVVLITRTFALLGSEPGLGRAGALRSAMLGLIDGAGASSHPAYWAPFVVVGESGR